MAITADSSRLRAYRAICCSPFTVKLFQDIATRGVTLRAIADQEGVDRGYLTRSLALIPTENALLWLIQVGILRREVDGQGITDSFRLTPLGHSLLKTLSDRKSLPSPSFNDRVFNFLLQWDWLGLISGR